MEIPQILTKHNLYIDGTNFSGKIFEQTLPQVKGMKEDVMEGGLMSPVAVYTGIEKMISTYVLSEWNPVIFDGIMGSERRFTSRGYMQNNAKSSYIEVECGGTIGDINPGTWGAEGRSRLTIVMDVNFYSMKLSGREIYYIDVLNTVFRTNGVDRWDDLRTKLKL